MYFTLTTTETCITNRKCIKKIRKLSSDVARESHDPSYFYCDKNSV